MLACYIPAEIKISRVDGAVIDEYEIPNNTDSVLRTYRDRPSPFAS